MEHLPNIKRILADQLGIDEDTISPESNLIEDLGADSLDTVELAMAFEEDFDIEIQDEEMEDCNTVADIVTLIGRIVPAKG